MPNIVGHGGGCCGVRHMYNFGMSAASRRNNSPENINRLLSDFGEPGNATGRSRGKCIEAVVTDTQFWNQPELAQTLFDAGFRIVSRFHNSSGGMCNVLHRVSGSRDIARAAARNPHVRILMGK